MDPESRPLPYSEHGTCGAGGSLTSPGLGLYLRGLQHGVTACLLGLPGLEEDQGAALSWLHICLEVGGSAVAAEQCTSFTEP